MMSLFGKAVISLLRTIGTLLVILLILIAFGWISDEVKRQDQEESEIATKKGLAEGMEVDLKGLEQDLDRHEAEWKERVETKRRELVADLHDMDGRIARTEESWKKATAGLVDLRKEARAARKTANEAKTRLQVLEKESAWWDLIFDREKILELEMARAGYALLDAEAKAWEAAREGLEPKLRQSPLSHLKNQRDAKTKAIADLLNAESPKVREVREAQERKARQLNELRALIESQEKRVAMDPINRLLAVARNQLATALWVLAGLMVMPMLIKVFFYFIAAPIVERLPAMCIVPNDRAPLFPEPPPSDVSVALDIGPNEQAFIHADFLQSSSRQSRKRTQCLLNRDYPFASLASGMTILTRIQPEPGTTTRVVVSSQKDPLGEIGLIDIPENGAMVIQPRSLAGVVTRTGSTVRITSKWRHSSPHAWLTLQLRYLVFHGPCKLILKGCRGVRVESPAPGGDRLINQAATLGFSANLLYKNTRCETFVSYFRGQEDLFNDLFSGGPGVFVYEEMPALGRKTGITGRGLEGVVDAFLKAFGI